MNNFIKMQLADLAVFGGQPAFQHMLHVGRPNIGNQQELLERIQDILTRKWFTNDGPVVQELEKRSNYTGLDMARKVKKAILVHIWRYCFY